MTPDLFLNMTSKLHLQTCSRLYFFLSNTLDKTFKKLLTHLNRVIITSDRFENILIKLRLQFCV